MDPIAAIINKLIQQHLPSINQAIAGQVRSRNLDPLVHVASGSTRLGSINLGLCTAYVEAGYEVDNLRGLSSLTIGSLQVEACGTCPQTPGQVNGTLSILGSLGGISAGIGGNVKAGCGFISHSVGLSGNASASSVQANGTGSFQASIANGQVSLNSVQLNQLEIHYSGLTVNINGLGIFNDFLRPLDNFILGLFYGQISSVVAQALTPVLNTQIGNVLPLSTSLSA